MECTRKARLMGVFLQYLCSTRTMVSHVQKLKITADEKQPNSPCQQLMAQQRMQITKVPTQFNGFYDVR